MEIITLQYCGVFWPYIKMSQRWVYICPPSWNPLPPPSHPIPLGCSRAGHSKPVLKLALNLHLSSILHIVIYMSQCYSLRSSHSHLLPHGPKFCSLHLCLLCCPTYRIIITIFLHSIYMYQYTVLVFLFLTYFTLYNRLQIYLPH